MLAVTKVGLPLLAITLRAGGYNTPHTITAISTVSATLLLLLRKIT